MHLKIINRCRKLAKKEGVRLRQSYTRTVKKLVRQVRFGRRTTDGAMRKLKTIAGRLVRELDRQLSAEASMALDTKNGLIVGALSFTGNPYDGRTLEPTLNQIHRVMEAHPRTAIVDRGYRGRSQIGDTEILVPDNGR